MAKSPSPDDPDRASRPNRKKPARPSSDFISFAKAARFRGLVESRESRREMEARLAIEMADADRLRTRKVQKAALEEWRERLTLKSGLLISCVVGVYCLALNAWPGTTTEQRAWATSTLTGIVGGLVG
jgi:hypothetical protein